MKYYVDKNSIIFDKTDDFDAKAILECGQLFRYFEVEDGYKVITGNNIAHITEKDGKVIIKTKNTDVFINYFDLDTDYSKIKQELKKYPILDKAIEFGKGVRIVKGNPEEVIFHFIISQNNNIKRIQKIIEKMSELGDVIEGEYRSFPSAKVLSRMPKEYFSSLGAGYRDRYLYEAAQVLANENLVEIAKLSDEELLRWLLKFNGIGNKVARCIMLFGFNRLSSFPVDTWIEKVYREFFYEGEKTREQITSFLQDKFGVMSGITQQYLFYYFRSGK